LTLDPDLPLEVRRDGFGPAAELSRVRDEEGVLRVDTPFAAPAYLVCRYQSARQILSDPARFSSAGVTFPGSAEIDAQERARTQAGSMLSFDPPEHTRLRRMLAAVFTPHRMRLFEPRIREIVDSVLDDMERAGQPADLVVSFARPVPSLVIAALLGVPGADSSAHQEGGTGQIGAAWQSREYIASVVARARTEPGEGVLGMLVREHGDDLSTDELIGLTSLLLLAGRETTANMLSLGTMALLRHPDQLAMLREDPARVEPAVEELLRWLSIVPSLLRMTTADVSIAGHHIPAGALLIVSLPAANRDRAIAGDADALDIGREASAHVAFGAGVHHCLGAWLARAELRVAFPALLGRFPGLALADPAGKGDFRVSRAMFGLNSLPVTWLPTRARQRRQAEVAAQGRSRLIVGPQDTSLLQHRNDPVDELVKAARNHVRHQDETVAGAVADVIGHRGRDRRRRPDE
jgi:cytochrome P450